MLSEVHSSSLVSRSGSNYVCPTQIPSQLSHHCHSWSPEEPYFLDSGLTPGAQLLLLPLSLQVPASSLCFGTLGGYRVGTIGIMALGEEQVRTDHRQACSFPQSLLLLTDTAPPSLKHFPVMAAHCRQEAKSEEI